MFRLYVMVMLEIYLARTFSSFHCPIRKHESKNEKKELIIVVICRHETFRWNFSHFEVKFDRQTAQQLYFSALYDKLRYISYL